MRAAHAARLFFLPEPMMLLLCDVVVAVAVVVVAKTHRNNNGNGNENVTNLHTKWAKTIALHALYVYLSLWSISK